MLNFKKSGGEVQIISYSCFSFIFVLPSSLPCSLPLLFHHFQTLPPTSNQGSEAMDIHKNFRPSLPIFGKYLVLLKIFSSIPFTPTFLEAAAFKWLPPVASYELTGWPIHAAHWQCEEAISKIPFTPFTPECVCVGGVGEYERESWRGAMAGLPLLQIFFSYSFSLVYAKYTALIEVLTMLSCCLEFPNSSKLDI